jgi:hypothetical protein
MTITRLDAVLIGSWAITDFWKSRPLTADSGRYWISGEVHERFRPQLQGHLYVPKRSWVDILCWHDVLPKVVVRVEPDEEFIKAPNRELQIFNYFIERVMEKICATNELRIAPGKLTLKATLCASLGTVPDPLPFAWQPAFSLPWPAPSLSRTSGSARNT